MTIWLYNEDIERVMIILNEYLSRYVKIVENIEDSNR